MNMTPQKGDLRCLPKPEGPPDLVLVARHVPACCPAAPPPHLSPPAPRLLPLAWGWWSRDAGGVLTVAIYCQGEVGQYKLMHSTSLEAAKKAFEKKFWEKTKNSWAARENFVAQPGKYTLIEVQPGAGQEAEVALRVSVLGSWRVTMVGCSSHPTPGPLGTRTSKWVSRMGWVLGGVWV